jgi:DNA-binding response OmpR family regulator
MENDLKEIKKILVIETVEDDASLLSVLNEKFTLEGFSVLKAKDGEEGLAVALREHPDLIMLDILMPKMDGIEMMARLRQANEWGKRVPIILLTNLNGDDERIIQAIRDYMPAYFIVKSNFKIDDLVEKIKERLSGQQ